MTNVAEILDSSELQRAYDIHGKYYDGEEVTEEDATFYSEYVEKLVRDLRTEFVEKKSVQEYPMGLVIWLMYAIKYI